MILRLKQHRTVSSQFPAAAAASKQWRFPSSIRRSSKRDVVNEKSGDERSIRMIHV
uniref:Uncharacterized protein n=1 Tax=Helianthus annuus TaxID=4232 RepID=A0A251SQ93_HELAN